MTVKTRARRPVRKKHSGSKRKGIFEVSEVEVGYEFVLRLVSFRLASLETRPLSKEDRAQRFKRDKDRIAKEMGYDSYVALPKGAKSFESRCSSIQRIQKGMKFSAIAQQEKMLNQKLCDELYASVMEVMEKHVEKRQEAERRRLLVLRMCRYNKQ